MILHCLCFRRLSVIKKHQLVFVDVIHIDVIHLGEMIHLAELTSGSRLRRSFWTARKILCFVALAPVPSANPISSIDKPSKCRRMKAALSCPLSSSSAAWTPTEIWLLYSSRSGPGVRAGMDARTSLSGFGPRSRLRSRVFRLRSRSRAQFDAMLYSQVEKLARASYRSIWR